MKGSEYNIIAGFYDDVIGRDNHSPAFILKNIRKHNRKAGSLLEMGCGTGLNLIALKKNFDSTGIDISEKMLALARKKSKDITYHKKDIRSFDLKRKFDSVICVYDTINHLTSFNDWKKVFANAAKHLNEGGVFIFDINTIYKLGLVSELSPVMYKFGKNFLIIDVKHAGKNVYKWNLKIFERTKNGLYRLHEVNIDESSFELTRITAALAKHFEVKAIMQEDGKSINEKTARIYFVCKLKQQVPPKTFK